jgi:hypothetical protein
LDEESNIVLAWKQAIDGCNHLMHFVQDKEKSRRTRKGGVQKEKS